MPDGDPRYLCSLCFRMFESRDVLREHQRKIHEIDGPLEDQPHPTRGSGHWFRHWSTRPDSADRHSQPKR